MRRASFYLVGHARAHAVQRILNWLAAIALGLIVGGIAGAGF